MLVNEVSLKAKFMLSTNYFLDKKIYTGYYTITNQLNIYYEQT